VGSAATLAVGRADVIDGPSPRRSPQASRGDALSDVAIKVASAVRLICRPIWSMWLFRERLARFTLLALRSFGNDQGWFNRQAFTRHVADLSGDGFGDVIGFG